MNQSVDTQLDAKRYPQVNTNAVHHAMSRLIVRPNDVETLQVALLKPAGRVVYSTCTIELEWFFFGVYRLGYGELGRGRGKGFGASKDNVLNWIAIHCSPSALQKKKMISAYCTDRRRRRRSPTAREEEEDSSVVGGEGETTE
jgi:hypothetical protein